MLSKPKPVNSIILVPGKRNSVKIESHKPQFEGKKQANKFLSCWPDFSLSEK